MEFKGSRAGDMMLRRCLTDICEDGWESDASYSPGANVFHISKAAKSEQGRPLEIRKTRSQRIFSSLLHFRNQQRTPPQAGSATGAEMLDITSVTTRHHTHSANELHPNNLVLLFLFFFRRRHVYSRDSYVFATGSERQL